MLLKQQKKDQPKIRSIKCDVEGRGEKDDSDAYKNKERFNVFFNILNPLQVVLLIQVGEPCPSRSFRLEAYAIHSISFSMFLLGANVKTGRR